MTSSYVETLLDGTALDDALHDVALQAERVLDGVDAAGVAVHIEPREVLGASNTLAAVVDAAQYRIGNGPCLHAFRSNMVVVLDLANRNRRWPVFEAAALASGVRTVLSVPLRLDGHAIGSLNLYSRAHRAYSARAVREAELFARPASLRLSSAGFAVHAVEAAEVVGLELQDRDTVDRALGVLMEVHQDGSVKRARVRLEHIATEQGRGVALAAASIAASLPGPGV